MNRKLMPLQKKRSKKKKDIIREGDRVKIIEPYVFKRCGYELTLEKSRKAVSKCPKYKKLKQQMMALLPENESRHPRHRISRKIDDILAEIYITQKGFGGKYRKLHTEYCKGLEGIICVVESYKFHKTGSYVPGCGYIWSYEGDYEYEYPFLDNEKTHKILELSVKDTGELPLDKIEPSRFWKILNYDYMNFWMEDVNVKKLIEGEEDVNVCPCKGNEPSRAADDVHTRVAAQSFRRTFDVA